RRPYRQSENGVHVITSEDYRWLKCHVKSLNLLANVMEKERAVKAGAHETVMHRDGVVTEGSSTNVFIVRNGILKTHPADNLILNGITRQEVLRIAGELDVPVEEAGLVWKNCWMQMKQSSRAPPRKSRRSSRWMIRLSETDKEE